MKMFEDSFPAFKMTLLIVSTIFVIGFGSFAMRCVQNKYIVTEYNSLRQSSKLQHIRRTGRNCTFWKM